MSDRSNRHLNRNGTSIFYVRTDILHFRESFGAYRRTWYQLSLLTILNRNQCTRDLSYRVQKVTMPSTTAYRVRYNQYLNPTIAPILYRYCALSWMVWGLPSYFLTILAAPPGRLMPAQDLDSTWTVMWAPSVPLGHRHGPTASATC